MKRKITLLSGIALLSASAGFGQYCTTGLYSYGCQYMGIDAFTLNTINNTTYCASGSVGYSDYTNITTTLTPSQSYAFSITSNGYPQHSAIYIDLNYDGDFNDAGELLYTNGGSYQFGASGNITAPSAMGVYRLRVRTCYYYDYNGYYYLGAGDACRYEDYGEIEDYTVIVAPPGLQMLAPNPLYVSCYGDSTDIAPTFTVGGQSPYSYLWNTGATTSTLGGVFAGTYTCTVTDNNNNTNTLTVDVLNPDSISLTATLTQSLVCDYDIAQAVAEASGGTPLTESYLWDTNSALFDPEASGGTAVTFTSSYASSNALPIGFDFVFFGETYDEFKLNTEGFLTFDLAWNGGWTSDHPMPANASYMPTNLIAFAWDELNPTASGASVTYRTEGTAPNRRLIITYENVPGEYTWIGNMVNVQVKLFETTNCIEIHTTGSGPYFYNYQVQGIENVFGANEAYYVPGRNYQYMSSGLTNDFTRFCPVDTSGLKLEWSTGDIGSIALGLQPGIHTVTATDVNGCMKTANVTVTPSVSALTSNLSVTDVSCFGLNNATINPAITGGSGTVNYTWSSGQSGSSFSTLTGVSPGIYSVSAEDAVNCTIEVNDILVVQPDLLQVVATNIEYVACPGDTTGSAEGIAWGGVGPYNFLWTPGGSTSQTISGVANGNYLLAVTDANGCERTLPVAIESYGEAPMLDLGPDITLKDGGSYTLDAGVQKAYAWSGGGNERTKEVAESGTYAVTVTNDDGCTATDAVVVEVWPTGVNELGDNQLSVYPNPASAILNIEFGATLNNAVVSIVDAKGATVSTATLGSNGLQTISVDKLPAGIYTLNVTSSETVATHRLVITK